MCFLIYENLFNLNGFINLYFNIIINIINKIENDPKLFDMYIVLFSLQNIQNITDYILKIF